MKQLKFMFLMLPLVLLSVFASAQKNVITGKVTDQKTGDPIGGVNVLSESKKGGVVTNADGTYSINVKNGASSLVFSYVGYTTKVEALEGKTTINVALIAVVKTIDEVVVIGYGTQKKSSVTGAVSKYKNEKLDESAVSRLDQALQGKIAGVQVQNTSSEAGSDPKVRVRGISSINAGASPLVVVDGHPVPDGLAFVNMADVESVEVLKDAASAAIYGSRGASGVIIITTKSGKADKPKYNFKYSTGAKTAYSLYPILTTTEYTNLLFYEATLKAKDTTIAPLTLTTIANNGDRTAYIIENDVRDGQATDWQREAIRNAKVQNILLSVSGGSKALRYYISGNYQNDQGMMYHSEYERFNVKSKMDAQLSPKMKLTFNFNPSYFKREKPSQSFTDFFRFPTYIPVYLNEKTAAFARQNPLFPDLKAGDWGQARYFNGRSLGGYMPDGSYWSTTNSVDAFGTANNTPKSAMETRKITTDEYRALTSGDLTINLASGLDFKTLASVYVNYNTGLDFAKRNSNRAGDVNKGVYNNRLFLDLLSENTLNYSKQIKDHSINVLAGFTAQKTKVTEEQVTGLDYPSDNVTSLNTALITSQDKADTYNRKYGVGLISYLGRVQYSFKNKYLFSSSVRADGSSKFAPGNKWGYFPSVSVGWLATKEKFLSSVKWLSNLKFRGSYGATGNNNIQDYGFVDMLYTANYPLGAGNGTTTTGQVPSTDILSNGNITWERTFQYNGGVDLALFKNKLSLSLDVYESNTDQLLLRQSAMGFTGVPQVWNNIGSVKNNGIELEISTTILQKRDFKWLATGNISHTQNRVTALGSEALLLNQGERTELYLNKIGAPLIQFFGYKNDGVWLSQAEINDAKTKGLTSALSNYFVPGGLKLIDVNGDNVLDVNDRTVIGNPYPDFNWGVTNNFNYKGFDFSFTFQGVQGGSLINGDPNYNEVKRTNLNYITNRWLSPMNPGDGKTPYSTNGFSWLLTDYVVEDASYYALRDLLVGYTVPQAWTKKYKLNSLRFYFSAQNLYYHTAAGFRGINPESRFTSGPYNTPLVDGYQRGSFPINKTFLFGVDLNF
jgi:TonB-linked SusC/RagA family outer membrane protein